MQQFEEILFSIFDFFFNFINSSSKIMIIGKIFFKQKHLDRVLLTSTGENDFWVFMPLTLISENQCDNKRMRIGVRSFV